MDILRARSFKAEGLNIIVTLTYYPESLDYTVAVSEFDLMSSKVIRFARHTFDSRNLADQHFEGLIS